MAGDEHKTYQKLIVNQLNLRLIQKQQLSQNHTLFHVAFVQNSLRVCDWSGDMKLFFVQKTGQRHLKIINIIGVRAYFVQNFIYG